MTDERGGAPDAHTDVAGTRRLFVGTPGFEAAMAAELPPSWAVAASGDPPGIVEAIETPAIGIDALPPLDPIFARQQLPAARQFHGVSIAALADAAYAHIADAVDRLGGRPFSIHAFVPTGEGAALGSRADLVGVETLARLRERRRRATRGYRSAEDAAAAFAEIELLIQILLVERNRVWVSAARPQALPGGGWDIAPWPGGVAPVADDRLPPSRAYRKLEEAFVWMNDQPAPGALCIDLGGAPGGWSYTALRRGARVIAVDRARLEAPALGHPKLTMIEGNAFTYHPPRELIPVDWMLSDVICEPARALALCERWMSEPEPWCRRLVATVKFKGQNDYGMLADVRALLDRARWRRSRIKHLHHNKNEVTVMATAPEK